MASQKRIGTLVKIEGLEAKVVDFMRCYPQDYINCDGSESIMFRVNYIGEGINGKVALTLTKDTASKTLSLTIDRIDTVPERCGLGTRIVGMVRNMAVTLGVKEIKVESLREATGFWLKMGVKPTSQEKGFKLKEQCLWEGRLPNL